MTNVILASEFVTDTMALILRIEKHRKLTYSKINFAFWFRWFRYVSSRLLNPAPQALG